MKRLSLIITYILIANSIYSQGSSTYQKGITAEQNLKAIGNLSPYTPGGVGFDNRYEGIKGSPRLFGKLLPSFLKLNGQENYMQLEADIDLMQNIVLFTHPKTGTLLSLPSGMVSELVITSEGKEMIFRTTSGKNFEKELKEQKFYQVLKSGPFMFIKMPVKTFTEADYKGAYSADRRYDEYETTDKYYIFTDDGIFHQIQLNKKSLIKLFPGKKEIINATIESKTFENEEEMVLAVLEKF
jgi:hypothetical protein